MGEQAYRKTRVFFYVSEKSEKNSCDFLALPRRESRNPPMPKVMRKTISGPEIICIKLRIFFLMESSSLELKIWTLMKSADVSFFIHPISNGNRKKSGNAFKIVLLWDALLLPKGLDKAFYLFWKLPGSAEIIHYKEGPENRKFVFKPSLFKIIDHNRVSLVGKETVAYRKARLPVRFHPMFSWSEKKWQYERVSENFFLVFFKNSQGYTWKLEPFWFE